MQEGWDLIDEKVKLAIINTINETENNFHKNVDNTKE